MIMLTLFNIIGYINILSISYKYMSKTYKEEDIINDYLVGAFSIALICSCTGIELYYILYNNLKYFIWLVTGILTNLYIIWIYNYIFLKEISKLNRCDKEHKKMYYTILIITTFICTTICV